MARLNAVGIESLRPLLVVQLVLLAGFLTLGVAADARANPTAPTAVLAPMFGVSAMAAQNALVQVSVRGAPTTAVMTTDLTRFTMDVGEILLGNDASASVAARRRASHAWPAMLGFAVGAALGAGLYAILGLAFLVLPTGLALISLSAARTGAAARRRNERPQGVGGSGGDFPTATSGFRTAVSGGCVLV